MLVEGVPHPFFAYSLHHPLLTRVGDGMFGERDAGATSDGRDKVFFDKERRGNPDVVDKLFYSSAGTDLMLPAGFTFHPEQQHMP